MTFRHEPEMADPPDGDMLGAFEDAIRRANERIATCHERVACPRCGAAVGDRCVRVNARSASATLQHSHTERLRAAGIALR